MNTFRDEVTAYTGKLKVPSVGCVVDAAEIAAFDDGGSTPAVCSAPVFLGNGAQLSRSNEARNLPADWTRHLPVPAGGRGLWALIN